MGHVPAGLQVVHVGDAIILQQALLSVEPALELLFLELPQLLPKPSHAILTQVGLVAFVELAEC